MTQKTFLGVVLVLLIVVVGFVIYKSYYPSATDRESNLSTEEQNALSNGQTNIPSSFAWNFTEADTMNLDGMPETDLSLIVVYVDGHVEQKLIDTTPGSCNNLPDAEADSVPNTTNVQCYYAGLGYKYKITEGPNSYQVLRQTFEEGTPDYAPAPSEYEVVAEFPLAS